MIQVVENIITEYCAKYKLLDWILENKLNYEWLSKKPNAIHLLEKNPDKIYWEWLSENSPIFKLIKPMLNL